MYLIRTEGAGNGIPLDWPAFFDGLKSAYEVISIAANVGGAAYATRALLGPFESASAKADRL
jgi:hypothetical protein